MILAQKNTPKCVIYKWRPRQESWETVPNSNQHFKKPCFKGFSRLYAQYIDKKKELKSYQNLPLKVSFF